MTGPKAEEFEILARWREGDARAGDVLVRRYYPSILRFFELRSRNAEDLTQRTFLAVVEGREKFRGDASFRTYLFVIARRILFREIQTSQRDDSLSAFGGAHAPDAMTSVSALVSRRQEQQLLLAAIAMLDEADQSMLVLHYWEGMVSREIGAVFEMPTSTITTRLSRARATLRKTVESMRSAGRAADAVLEDLDGWVRSVADSPELGALESSLYADLLRSVTPRPPGS